MTGPSVSARFHESNNNGRGNIDRRLAGVNSATPLPFIRLTGLPLAGLAAHGLSERRHWGLRCAANSFRLPLVFWAYQYRTTNNRTRSRLQSTVRSNACAGCEIEDTK